jgi:O-acetyl-ADP-ribose deacetylase (regulator of RNase III)
MKTTFSLMQQGVTNLSAEAIVSGTNTSYFGKDGICQKGGHVVQAACQQLLLTHSPMQVGDTFITAGGALIAKKIVHVVGPMYNPSAGEENFELLRLCYRNALAAAQEAGIKTLAFTTISTGMEQFPRKAAAECALDAVSEYLKENASHFQAIWFVCSEMAEYNIYEKRWDEFLKFMA